jgi:NUMOD4 motif/NUMOD1 domain
VKKGHYNDKTLISLKGERWKDIPHFEGLYKVSNLGRVKSLDRIILHPRLKEQFVAGRILSQSIAKNRNIKTGKPMIDLRVSLSRDGVQYYFNTRRVVYAAFRKQIEFETDGMYVINKDGNGFNNALANLKLVTKREKSILAFKRGRVIESYLKTADRSSWKNYGGYTRRKPIKQYSMRGKLLGKYESILEACRKTGCGEKEIINVARGIYKQSKGFKWRYA